MNAREKRARRRRQRVREDILDAARALVLRDGVARLTLTRLADALELTKPALYYYFDSKDELLTKLLVGTMTAEVEAVEEAVATATTGAEAVEALIRAVDRHYIQHLDAFRLVYLAGQVGRSFEVEPALLERIRPLNDRRFGPPAELIRADQVKGRVPDDIEPRRAVFLAHCATLGVLTMEGVVDAADDAPLLHDHDALIDDLVRAHTAPLCG